MKAPEPDLMELFSQMVSGSFFGEHDCFIFLAFFKARQMELQEGIISTFF